MKYFTHIGIILGIVLLSAALFFLVRGDVFVSTLAERVIQLAAVSKAFEIKNDGGLYLISAKHGSKSGESLLVVEPTLAENDRLSFPSEGEPYGMFIYDQALGESSTNIFNMTAGEGWGGDIEVGQFGGGTFVLVTASVPDICAALTLFACRQNTAYVREAVFSIGDERVIVTTVPQEGQKKTEQKTEEVSTTAADPSLSSGFDGTVVDTSAAGSVESPSEGLSVTPIAGEDVGVTSTTSSESTGSGETSTEITPTEPAEAGEAPPASAEGYGEARPEELFDIRLTLEKNQLTRLQDLAAVVTFDSFGSIPTPVSMLFFVTDDKGLLAWQGSTFENITVETSRVYRRLFAEAKKELSPGSYELYLRTSYGQGIVDGFSAPFEISKPAPAPSPLPFYAGLGALGVSLAVFIGWGAHYLAHHHLIFHHRIARRVLKRAVKKK